MHHQVMILPEQWRYDVLHIVLQMQNMFAIGCNNQIPILEPKYT